jgi:hypothetical protein
MSRRGIRALLLVIGIVCAVIFVSVFAEVYRTPAGNEVRWAIGFEPSPWLVYERRPAGSNVSVEPLSWSWLFGAAALVAFRLYHRTGRQAPDPIPPAG